MAGALLVAAWAQVAGAQEAPAPATPANDPPPATAPVTAFVDEFETLDPERWLVSDGWRNGDHQNCQWTADSVAIVDGVLRITLSDRPADGVAFSCGEVQSQARLGYGTFEARLRIPFFSGTNANFFTFAGEMQKVPHNELDFEFIAKAGPTLQTNFFKDGIGGREQLHRLGGDWVFRNYALVWSPGLVQWFVDGQLIREARGPDIPTIPQKVFFSLWSTGMLTDWLGPLDYPGQPIVMEVDRFAYTPEGAPCAFDGSLACVQPMDPQAELPLAPAPPPALPPAAPPATATVPGAAEGASPP
jgi:endo-1,3-1,4-beta-glycanase ExoK